MTIAQGNTSKLVDGGKGRKGEGPQKVSDSCLLLGASRQGQRLEERRRQRERERETDLCKTAQCKVKR